jgi:acetyl-CoA carboxylase beta subunit
MTKTSPKLNISSSHLVCPQCLEVLVREDVEGFGRCPYCDHAFELDAAMEDFLLSPVVAQWASQQHPAADSPRL